MNKRESNRLKSNYGIYLMMPVFIIPEVVIASGSHWENVTYERMEKYRSISLSSEALRGETLNYVGTAGKKHILMVEKTTVSKRSDGSPGRPWRHVFGYTLSTDQVTIVNGWDISEKLKHGGLNVRPSYCPKILLSAVKHEFRLPAEPKVKDACLKSRSPRF